MVYLADTNVIWRRFATSDPSHVSIKEALDALLLRGETVCITAQNLVEFQALATRPMEANGLGLTSQKANKEAKVIESLFSFLPETPDIYARWRRLMESHDIKGRQVYDARLVAVMQVYGITHLLTLDANDFDRYTDLITVVTPQSITAR